VRTRPTGLLRSARLSVAGVFLVHAAVAGTLAPRIPAIKAHLDLTDGALGAALTGFAAGLFAGTRAAAWLVDRFGSRRVVRAGLPLLAASLVGPGLASSLAGLTASLVVLGLAAGLLDVAMNAQAVEVERGYARPIMAGLHGMWSLGVLAASVVAAGIAAAGVGVLAGFAAAAVVLVPVAVVVPLGLLPGSAPAARPAAPEPARRGSLPIAILALGAIGFCSFLGEGAAADWSGVYARDTVGAGSGLAAFAFTAFAVGMVASRFSADRLTGITGPVAVVRAGGLLASAGLTVGLAVLAWPATFVAFALLGLGLAPLVPIAFSAAGNLGSGARALGWVVTMSYVGSVLGPAAIGFVAHTVGLRAGLVIPAALAFAAALLAPYARTAAGATSEPDREPPIP
jgi:MFS family permease